MMKLKSKKAQVDDDKAPSVLIRHLLACFPLELSMKLTNINFASNTKAFACASISLLTAMVSTKSHQRILTALAAITCGQIVLNIVPSFCKEFHIWGSNCCTLALAPFFCCQNGSSRIFVSLLEPNTLRVALNPPNMLFLSPSLPPVWPLQILF
jgi:hypothetical protein